MVQVVKCIVNELGHIATIGDRIQIKTRTPIYNGYVGRIRVIDGFDTIHFEDGVCQPLSTLVTFSIIKES